MSNHDKKELAEYLHTVNQGAWDDEIIEAIAAMAPAQLRVRLYPYLFSGSKKFEVVLMALAYHKDKMTSANRRLNTRIPHGKSIVQRKLRVTNFGSIVSFEYMLPLCLPVRSPTCNILHSFTALVHVIA